MRERLAEVQQSHRELSDRFAELSRKHERQCYEKDRTEETLNMEQVIINHSPAILFRRIAGDDPRLVYVSNNIRQWGYTAEELLSGDITFKEIAHPEDLERIRDEMARLPRQEC